MMKFPIKKNNSSMPDISGFVASTRSLIETSQYFHWQITGIGSYAAHTAIGEFYDAISGSLDELVECYQGHCDHTISLKSITPIQVNSVEEYMGVLKQFTASLNEVGKEFDKDVILMSIQDILLDMGRTTLKTMYKLKFLK